MARPLLISISATSALVRIVTPCSRADAAIAFETEPIPPVTYPQAP